MSEDLGPLIDRIAQAIGRPLNDPSRLEEALTHRSYANEIPERSLKDNERYEFLGDAVLALAVSDYLMTRHPEESEGTLSKYRSAVVNERSLAQAARVLELGDFLRLGRGEELTQGRKKDSILANAFEAVLAAVYLSQGFEDAKRFVVDALKEPLECLGDPGVRVDYKTTLQELTQRVLKKTPVYRLVFEVGPDHEKVFESEVVIDEKVYGRGKAKSKKDSEQLSAQEAIATLQEELKETPSGVE
ncbi:MAG: ribonuclease III [Pseudomonadota bacterium]